MYTKTHKWIILLFVVSVIFANKTYATNNQSNDNIISINKKDSLSHKKRIYTISRITEAPVIDGKLNDSCWKIGEWQRDYTQYSPTYKAKSSRKTDLKLLYDDKNIYVAIRAFDTMNEITRRLSRRDSYAGDIVGVMFDSYFDHRTAFEFDITSACQKIDVSVADDQFDSNWNPIWYAKVAYEDSAWTAELAIPLTQLRYGRTKDQTWGFNAWRQIDRLQEESHWNLVANDGTGIVYTYGELRGLKDLKKNRKCEILPYVSEKYQTSPKNEGNPFATGVENHFNGGVDVKIGLANNFTLDATFNPDFGQVEADPSVMNLSAFETYFEEKRPFFVEGKNIFDFSFDSDQLFYSRRIGHAPSYTPRYDTIRMPEFTTIGGAIKLSGKTSNGLSIGVIESVTLKEEADIYENNTDFRQTVEPLSNYFIGRFQQDFDKGNTIIGGIVTYSHRSIKNDYLNFLSKNALTYGVDVTKYWDDRKYFVEIKAIGSNIYGNKDAIRKLQQASSRYFQRPDIRGIHLDTMSTSLSGYGLSLKLGKWSKGHWRYDQEFILRSSGLELNDLGYMTISNIIKDNTNISFYEKNNTGIFKTYTFSLLQQNAWDAQGIGLYSLVSLTAQSEFMNNWSLQLTSQYKWRILDEWLLRGGPSMKVPALLMYSWALSSNTSKKIYATFSGNYNRGANNNLNYVSMATEIGYRPLSNLTLSMQPSYLVNIDELQYIAQPNSNSSGKVYLLGKVDNRNYGITFKADLSLTPQLTVQYYCSPFISTGKFTRFKEVIDPRGSNYTNRFNTVEPVQSGQTYNFDTNKDGITDYSLPKPDFNYQQFRSNLVVRWEYKVGSAFYIVWAHNRTSYETGEMINLGSSLKKLYNIFPTNIFMVKFNYWLPI
jgi:hypothetical protein